MTDTKERKKWRFNFGLGEAGNEERTRRLGIQMICGFAAMTLVTISIITSVMLVRINNAMRNQTTQIMAVLNDQIATTISSQIDTVKGNVCMIFGTESYYKYDPTLTLGSVDAVTEAKLASDLAVYAGLAEYQDFCITYPYGHNVGQISDKTWGYYGNNFYSEMSALLGDKSEIWTTGPGNNYDSFYYIHRLNDNAIMVASLAKASVMSLLENTSAIAGTSIYVVDDSLIVQATNGDQNEIGSYLKSGVYRLTKRDGGVQISRAYMVCTSELSNGWLVVSAVPYTNITSELNPARVFVVIAGITMLVLTIAFTIFMTRRFINSVNQTVGKLDVKSQTDLLTGLLNKKSFEEIVDLKLSENFDQAGYAMVFMDVDNFKGVNDRCGHDIGDDVLRSFSHTISSVFREDDVKGRLGGDEFCVLMKLPHGASESEMHETINDICGRFREALHRKGTTGRQSMPAITSSMGAALSTSNEDTFEVLYRKADTALYHSKHKGKDTWSIYGEE